ncbi:MAG: GIY-YIG nuclease family protein [Nitrospira sp. SB0672_bin_25]|nr:GIY-YIG nuclease family protein [Nitrospira sp. SB0666_bin_27]MYF24256.1 GIY-YIG nuclease family protein [Nitrospira sp. SB0678_bin_10]MYJ54250.1 GIY-YIG nuclease family protein [Nitrospira sp. SB0672_bin_25]
MTEPVRVEDFYVYVYIDPRNFEEFYIGKGKGTRKDSHLSDLSGSSKSRRIRAILKTGLKPTIRVIARNLSEYDAFLVEKTLLWKLGDRLSNVASGHYARKFRPHNTFHRDLLGFDYQPGVYYYNVGEGPTSQNRNWDDFRTLGFISAGSKNPWLRAIRQFKSGDIVAAYLKGHGFVGIGRVTDSARPATEVVIKGKRLLDHRLRGHNMHSDYVAQVKWIAAVPRDQAKWERKAGLFTTQLVRASLDKQPKTKAFLEAMFSISFDDLLK